DGVVGESDHRPQVGKARPEAVQRRHVGALDLAAASRPEALARILQIPEVEVTDLGSLDRHQPRHLAGAQGPGVAAADGDDLVQARRPTPELGRFLYTAVGGNWYWTDRLGWTYQQWAQRMVETETWVTYLDGTPAGYFELDASVPGDVEIAYFGLLPAFIGRG